MLPLEALVDLARREGKFLIVNGKVIYEPPKDKQCQTKLQSQDSSPKEESSK
jgi:hypothetical protein